VNAQPDVGAADATLVPSVIDRDDEEER